VARRKGIPITPPVQEESPEPPLPPMDIEED